MFTSIGSNIKKWRKKKGYTQEELADQLGVTGQAVSRWESEAGMPDISFIVPLAQILGITTDTLFGMEEVQYDAEELFRVKGKVEEICKNGISVQESLLEACNYLKSECEKNPTNYEIMCIYVEKVAGLSRYVDFDKFLSNQPERWEALSTDGIRKGILVIRYSTQRELVERAHYAIAWIYIHANDFEKAREHIGVLPSVASNRLQEGISAQLAFWEGGFEEEKRVAIQNLQNFSKAISKEIIYLLEDYVWNATKDESMALGEWGLGVMDALAQREEMIPFVSHFRERSHVYMMSACMRAGDVGQAVTEYKRLRKEKEGYHEYCQKMLGSDKSIELFPLPMIEEMKKRKPEIIEKELENARNRVKKYCGAELYEKFLEQINIECP